MEVPRHVAIILDGNGRWAKSRNMPRNYGHVKGAANLEVICRAADDLGIKYLTVYLFSTENWRASQEEVHALMKLFHSYTRTAIRQARENNMRCGILRTRGSGRTSRRISGSWRRAQRTIRDSTSSLPSITEAGMRSCALSGPWPLR